MHKGVRAQRSVRTKECALKGVLAKRKGASKMSKSYIFCRVVPWLCDKIGSNDKKRHLERLRTFTVSRPETTNY